MKNNILIKELSSLLEKINQINERLLYIEQRLEELENSNKEENKKFIQDKKSYDDFNRRISRKLQAI